MLVVRKGRQVLRPCTANSCHDQGALLSLRVDGHLFYIFYMSTYQKYGPPLFGTADAISSMDSLCKQPQSAAVWECSCWTPLEAEVA